MNISDLIERLQCLYAEHGDLPVETWNVSMDRIPQRDPEVAYRKILTGRSTKPRFWHTFDGLDARGEKVVRL